VHDVTGHVADKIIIQTLMLQPQLRRLAWPTPF